jgi:hypothetical protein
MSSWSHKTVHADRLNLTIAEPASGRVAVCLAKLSEWAAGNGQCSKAKLIKVCNKVIAELDAYAAKLTSQK